jgi:hypothetical protein
LNCSFEYQNNTLIQAKAVAVIYGCKENIDQTNRVYHNTLIQAKAVIICSSTTSVERDALEEVYDEKKELGSVTCIGTFPLCFSFSRMSALSSDG